MSQESTVSVFAVGPGGNTADRLGSALLIDPLFAVAEPALAERLRSDPPGLRVRITSPTGGVEVLDVVALCDATGAPDLVALELTAASTAPPTVPPGTSIEIDELGTPVEPTDADLVAALRHLLGAGVPSGPPDEPAPPPPPPVPAPPPDHPVPVINPREIWRRLFPRRP